MKKETLNIIVTKDGQFGLVPKLDKPKKTSLEIRTELLKKKAEFDRDFNKKIKELDKKETEKKFKNLLSILTKNCYKFNEKDVQELEEYTLAILASKNQEEK